MSFIHINLYNFAHLQMVMGFDECSDNHRMVALCDT